MVRKSIIDVPIYINQITEITPINVLININRLTIKLTSHFSLYFILMVEITNKIKLTNKIPYKKISQTNIFKHIYIVLKSPSHPVF